MKTSEQIDLISAALCLAQAEIHEPVPDSRNPHFNHEFTSLMACLKVAKPILNKHGIVLIQATDNCLEKMELQTRLLHKSGQWIECSYNLKPVKDDPQGMGSAISYARRYSLKSMLGLSEADDDGNSASVNAPESKKAPPPQKTKAKSNKAPINDPGANKGQSSETPQNPLDYVIKFGKKSGLSLRSIPKDDLIDYIKGLREWLDKDKPKLNDYTKGYINELFVNADLVLSDLFPESW